MTPRMLFSACGEYIPSRRFYDFLEGVRVPTGWEACLMQQRLGIIIPWRYLRIEDRYGRMVKDRQLALPGLKGKS